MSTLLLTYNKPPMRNGNYWILGVLCLLSLGAAHAQRTLIHTQARSAYGEAGAQWVVSANMENGVVLSGAPMLPGSQAMGPLLRSADGKQAFLTTALDAPTPFTWLTVFQTLPFQPTQLLDAAALAGIAPCAQALYENAESSLEILFTDRDASGKAILYALPWDRDAVAFKGVSGYWELPGEVLRIIPLPATQRIVVLYRMEGGLVGGLTLARNTPDRFSLTELLSIPNTDKNHLVDAVASHDGKHLFSLSTGVNKVSKHKGIFTELHVLDVETLLPVTEPLRWEDTARRHSSALLPSGEGGCWAVTFSPEADAATALYACNKDDVWKIILRNPLFDVEGDFLLAAAPEGRDIAFTTATQLEIWRDGQRQGIVSNYGAPLQWLGWTEDGLLAGEANRLHRVDPATGASLVHVEMPQGEVFSAITLPESLLLHPDVDGDGLTPDAEALQGTNDNHPDADHDELHDGIDPHPISAHPRPDLPAVVRLRGEAAGQEIRSFRIGRPEEDGIWRIQYDRTRMPWLRIWPLTGASGELVRMGIDPALYPPGARYQEGLDIELLSAQPGYQHVRRSDRLPLVLYATEKSVARLLWVWESDVGVGFRNADDPFALAGLGDLLAAAPFYGMHRESIAPTAETLAPYAVVILSAKAAARGGVVRQALLEYLAQGGAVLLLGDLLEASAYRSLEQWLAPAGIAIQSDTPATNSVGLAAELNPYWEAVAERKGCNLQRLNAEGAVQDAAFIAQPYGKGRVAVLSSAAPLETAALQDQENRRFARALFRWLLRAGIDVEDLDGDGLPDSVEDINQNGVWDEKETDLLHPDTDRDGLPDGMEDRNYNGQVDMGETDPRSP